MGLVPTVLTKLPVDGLIDATIAGYGRLMGAPPSPEAASVAAGQAMLETGDGQKMRNWNPGNRKRPSGWEGDFCEFACDEIFDAPTAALAKRLDPDHCAESIWRGGPLIRCSLIPPHPWSEFVSFPTAAEGFSDWLGLLAMSDRYRAAWGRLYAGDPAGFVRALHAAGYMTADEEIYEHAVFSIAASVLPACRSRLNGGGQTLSDDDRSYVSGLVGLTLADTIWSADRHGTLAA